MGPTGAAKRGLKRLACEDHREARAVLDEDAEPIARHFGSGMTMVERAVAWSLARAARG